MVTTLSPPCLSTLKARSLIFTVEDDHGLSTPRVLTKDGDVGPDADELSLGHLLRLLLWDHKDSIKQTRQGEASWLETKARTIMAGKEKGVDPTQVACYVVGTAEDCERKIAELMKSYRQQSSETGTNISVQSSEPLPTQEEAFRAYLRSSQERTAA